MGKDDVGFLPAIGIGTLVVFYFAWAAMHDIARADESDYTLECLILAACIPAFAFLYRKAMLHLTPRAKVVWLAGAGLVTVLFSLAALSASLHPKYANDAMLGSMFLAAGLPVLGIIGYHLVRESRHGRIRRGS